MPRKLSFLIAALTGISGVAVGIAGCSGCASPRVASADRAAGPETPGLLEASAPAPALRKAWAKKLPGLITELSVARSGAAILITTVPDPERPGLQRDNVTWRFDGRGKLLWRFASRAQVKSQSIAEDGSLAVVATYAEEMVALGARGRVMWRAPSVCKPIALSKFRRVVCYHDDDAEPRVAFDVYSWEGKKIFEYPIDGDVLALKVSSDERNIALALTGGRVVLIGPDMSVAWDRRVPGELTDVAVSSGERPVVGALFGPREKRRIALLDSSGILAEGEPAASVQQLEIAPEGGSLAAYGNGPDGQYLVAFDTALALSAPPAAESANASGSARPPRLLPRKWHRRDRRAADYSLSMAVTRGLVVLGYEEALSAGRRSHLLGFDFDGNLRWNVPLRIEEGAYLYSHGLPDDASFLAAGTDDSIIGIYEVPVSSSPVPR